MSIQYRIKVRNEDMPSRYVVKLGCWSKLVFDNIKDATRCYEACAKALGSIKSHTFNLTVDGKEYDAVRDVVMPLGDDLTLQTEPIGTEGEVACNGTWERYYLCDGVPKGNGGYCSCWRTIDADEYDECLDMQRSDNAWQAYESGGTRHMCPTCQGKQLTVTTEVVTKVSGC
jgi:hypothetical protein